MIQSKISAKTFIDFYKIRQVPLKDIKDFKGIPIEKVLKYWRVKGLVPFMQKGHWARISFAELIWLRILDILRQFDTPIDKMKLVCTYFFHESYSDNLPEKNLLQSIDLLEAKKRLGTIDEYESELLESRKSILENHKIILELLKSDVNYLTNLIHIFLNEKIDCGIAIFSDFSISEVYNGVFIPHDSSREIKPNKHHIYLSMHNFLAEFIDNEELSSSVFDQILNENETYILNQLRNENINEINIQFKNDKIRIESSVSGAISKDDSIKIKEILGLKNYDRITINTRDENSLTFKRTKLKLN